MSSGHIRRIKGFNHCARTHMLDHHVISPCRSSKPTRNVPTESGWHYLAYPRCTKKFAGDDASEAKVDMPIARFVLRFEMEDNTGSTVFVTMDREVQKLVRHTASALIGGSILQ
ncbi:hypothetical protein MKW98_030491 [Papaver atlanticum]|uniref:Uncharacterized protein n=1 Tax=Papaver atlanticum TaxID=357466 RepID=A0AAD4XEV2_9MAGN|nr:hypothetical protein MKW98_030491 [Papaver atlanticum]